MGKSTINVRRKGYKRKSYTAKRGSKKVKVSATRVKPSTFKTRDRGKAGRGPKVVPPLEEGALGGQGFFDRPNEEQERIVFERSKEMGERKVVGELRALQVFFKRTDSDKSKRALELSKKVAGSFKGKQEVGYPHGFSSKKQ
ncbi:MAG: hypothetical protein M3258_09360 [Thermoproteota archaeon]|nr:hypothetical protein [Thermoproteota archaeon]